MAQNYISVMTSDLMTMFPNLSSTDATALAWGGLEKDAGSLFSDLSDVEKNSIAVINTNYRSGQSGNPCSK